MPNGILIIDKPEGWTSMDVCAKLRGILHEKRVGHGGTLDPMATGVLPVFAGRATRAVEFAADSDKEYIAGLLLGVVTNTQDTSGEFLDKRPVHVTQEELEAVLDQFRGAIEQVPPMYSAIKVNGKKLYELARKGREVERKPRPVTIHTLEATSGGFCWNRGAERPELPNLFFLRVRCSKGTYVRTLCHDIGQALGCGGCMSSLRRTLAAGFTLADTVTLEEAQTQGEALLRPLDSLFAAHPALTVRSPGQERRVRSGGAITLPGTADGTYRVYGQSGDFLCLSRARAGALTAVKNFF